MSSIPLFLNYFIVSDFIWHPQKAVTIWPRASFFYLPARHLILHCPAGRIQQGQIPTTHKDDEVVFTVAWVSGGFNMGISSAAGTLRPFYMLYTCSGVSGSWATKIVLVSNYKHNIKIGSCPSKRKSRIFPTAACI
jgi:hypothetical protein